jgi:hypothetical protein
MKLIASPFAQMVAFTKRGFATIEASKTSPRDSTTLLLIFTAAVLLIAESLKAAFSSLYNPSL